MIGGDEPSGAIGPAEMLDVHDDAWQHIVEGLTAHRRAPDVLRAVIDPGALSDRQARQLAARLLVHAITAERGLTGASDALRILGDVAEHALDGPPPPAMPVRDDYDPPARLLACALILDVWMDNEARRRVHREDA